MKAILSTFVITVLMCLTAFCWFFREELIEGAEEWVRWENER